MKRLVILVSCAFLLCNFLYGQSDNKIKIAVLDFPSIKGFSKKEAIKTTEKLIVELSNAENFSVVGREDVSKTKLLKKKMTPDKFQELGKALNVDYIVWSEIVQMYEEYFETRVNRLIRDTTRVEGFRFTDKYLVRSYIVYTKNGSVEYLVKDTVEGKNFEGIESSLSSGIIEKINTQPKEVIILSNMLYVYPEDVENIEITVVYNVCEDLNKKKMYGFDDWRPPTLEEMQLMQANARLIKDIKCKYYFLNDYLSVFDFCNRQKIEIKKDNNYKSPYGIWWDLTDEGKEIGYMHYLRPVRGETSEN